jgi:hypothetical protein
MMPVTLAAARERYGHSPPMVRPAHGQPDTQGRPVQWDGLHSRPAVL